MKVTVENEGEKREVDLYSQEGFDLVGELWLKLAAQYKLTHETTWMGIPIIQLPGDIMMMQELIWKVRPGAIVECGLAHGGSAIFYASLLENMGKGIVVGVDVDIRKYNKIAIQNHCMSDRIRLIEGSSTSPDTLKKVKEYTEGVDRVIVTLDSNHSKEHVAREIELYKDIVTPGSYLVVMDGAQSQVWDIPNGKPEWKHDNPLSAIEEFLEGSSEFVVDDHFTRLKVTANPGGFLKKVVKDEK